jgi:hypothetical protein
MINFTQNFFDLKILKISDIKLHETTETKRLRNIFDRISKDRKLMNPVIVAHHNGFNILIDGANRLSSLRDIGCKLVLAQIINYTNSRIKLKCWNHLIYGFSLNIIKDYCKAAGYKIKDLKYSDAYAIFRNEKNYILATDTKNLETLLIHLPGNRDFVVKELHNFTKLYFNRYSFDRSESEIKITDLKKYSRKYGILIEFPSFSKKDIISIATDHSRNKLPAGITRHILINRVLHVRYDIRNLLNDKEVEKKNTELEEYLIKKIDDNKVRQYKESVIVFDE